MAGNWPINGEVCKARHQALPPKNSEIREAYYKRKYKKFVGKRKFSRKRGKRSFRQPSAVVIKHKVPCTLAEFILSKMCATAPIYLADVGTARLMRIVFLIADVADVELFSYDVFGLFK